MDAAQGVVRTAIEHSRGVEALGEGAVEALVAEVEAAADVWALHQVVDRVPALKVQVCGYPDCFHPPRAPLKAGRPPAYCDLARDVRGDDAHTAIRSMRRRQQLRDGVSGPVVEPEAVTHGGERPVSYAREAVPVTASRVERVVTDAVAAIARGLDELRQQVALVGDEEAAAAEIEGIRHDAAQEVEQATGARLDAERAGRQHKAAADQAHAELGEAIAAAEDANVRAERIESDAVEQAQRDRAGVEAARADATRVREEASRDVAAAKAGAEAYAEQVSADRDRVLAERQGEHERLEAGIRQQADRDVATAKAVADEQVEAAQAVAEAARAAATEAARELDAVKQAAAKDRGVAEAAKAELDRARVELDRLASWIDTAEQRHTRELADAHRDTEKARGQVTAIQTRLDEATERHLTELAQLRREHRTELAGQVERVKTEAAARVEAVEAARDEAAGQHRGELAQLRREHREELAADRQRTREEHQAEVHTLRDALTALRPPGGK